MISCRKSKDMMIEALYGELPPAEKEAFHVHLQSCPNCASEYSVLGATLRVMDERRLPDPGPEFWDNYWDRLAAKMDKEDAAEFDRVPIFARLRRSFAALPRWSYQAAAGAVLVVLGILIGRSVFAPSGGRLRHPGASAPSSLAAVSNDPAVRAQRYIERSQVLLLGLVNYDPKTQDLYCLDLAGKKAVSRELAGQAADIRSSLKDPRQKRLRDLVSELEVILMQIANLDAANDLDGVELVKEGVEQKGIFLKIDLTRMASAAGGDVAPPARPKSGGSSRPKNANQDKI